MERIPNELNPEAEDIKNILNQDILKALDIVREFKDAEVVARGMHSEINRSNLLINLAIDRYESGLDYLYLIEEAEKNVRRIKKQNDKFTVLKQILLAKQKTNSSADSVYVTFEDIEDTLRDFMSKRISDENTNKLIRLAIQSGLFEEAKDLAYGLVAKDEKAREYRKIALAEFNSGLNPKDSLIEAKETNEKIHDAISRSLAFASQAEIEFETGLDFEDSLKKAKENAENIRNPKSKKERFRALQRVAKAELKVGLKPTDTLLELKEIIKDIESNIDKCLSLIEIIKIEENLGLDPKEAFNEIEKICSELNNDEKVFILNKLAQGQIDAGLFMKAKLTIDKILESENVLHQYTGKSRVPDLFIKIAKEELKAKSDFTETLENTRQYVSSIHNEEAKATSLCKIAEVEIEAGNLADAKKTADSISSMKYRSIILEKIAIAEAREGDFKVAREIAEEIPFNLLKARAISSIAKTESKKRLLFDEIKSLDNEAIFTLLSQNRDDISYALGYFRPESIENSSDTLPSFVTNSALLGRAEREHDKKKIFEVASSVKNESSYAEKRALSRSLQHLDYELVSNQLLAKVRNEKDPTAQLRYLKTLIEIENPKGRNLATKLYVNPELSPDQKEYIMRKLISHGYWDKELGPFLQNKLDNGISKTEIDNIITQIIDSLNLVPDRMTYEALETKGFLKGETLQERLSEIMSHKERFESLDRDSLLELFKNDENSMKLFYLVKGGEYFYSLINDYRFDKFKLVIDKINSLEIDKKKITRFRASLNATDLPKKDIAYILNELKEGRFPYMEESRVITFNSSVEEGSEYSKYTLRLQEVWNDELFKLLITSLTAHKPNNMGELDSLVIEEKIMDDPGQHPRRVKRFIEQFKIGEKQSQQSIQELAELMKKELLQRAKQKGDKGLKEKLSTSTTSDIIFEYLDTFLPDLNDMGAYSEEWKSHLKEVLIGLEATESKKEDVKTKEIDFDLTFLDKGKDFIRAVRFADSQQCCFNSTNYVIHSNQGSADWIARLNKDPLSFVIDIKVKDTKQITGFVFGRMGINPQTNKPVVMLNGVYSQNFGTVFVNNVLKIIEDNFAKKIGADLLVVASKHGGRLDSAPNGYQQVGKDIKAIRAIDEEKVYDDIGQIANGRFYFTSGYIKDIV